MKRYGLHLIMFFLLLVGVGCRRSEDLEGTGIAAVGTFAPVFQQAQPVTLSELSANPEAFRDQVIEITGQFQPLPRLVCVDTRPHPTPAGWELAEGEATAPVGGFDQEVRNLVPAGLEMTVRGTWRFWEGDVGCGKRTTPTELWYLEGEQIVSPSPLVRVTLTPDAIAEATRLSADSTVAAAAPSPVPSPTANPTVTVAPEAASPTPAASPVTGTFTATAILGATLGPGTPSATPSAATTGTTPPPGEATASTTPTPDPSGTASTTPTAGAQPGITDMGAVGTFGFPTIALERLESGESHSYTFTIDESGGNTVSISLVMQADRNPAFIILSPQGQTLVEQNQAATGEVERLPDLVLPTGGTYGLIVEEAGGLAADYSFTIGMGGARAALYFAGTLGYDSEGNGVIREPQEHHYWHFQAAEGDLLQISVIPNQNSANSNVRFQVWDPQLNNLFECEGNPDPSDCYVDARGAGQPEQESFVVPETGFYTIDVMELDFRETDYLLTLREQ